jgi:hypothetical protein
MCHVSAGISTGMTSSEDVAGRYGNVADAPTRRITVAVLENVATPVASLVQQAGALGTDVDVDQHPVVANGRTAERLKTEFGYAVAGAGDRPAIGKAAGRDVDAA